MTDLKEEKKEEEKEETFCEWHSYNSNKCGKKSNSKKFCVKHESLKNDFKLLKDLNVKDLDLICCKELLIKVPRPRSKEHIIEMMKLHKIDGISDNVIDVQLSRDCIEEASTESDDYIELSSDGARYYYDDKVVRGKHKTKELQVIFKKYCDNKPIIQIVNSEDVYCKECYVYECKNSNPLNQKYKYPSLKILQI